MISLLRGGSDAPLFVRSSAVSAVWEGPEPSTTWLIVDGMKWEVAGTPEAVIAALDAAVIPANHHTHRKILGALTAFLKDNADDPAQKRIRLRVDPTVVAEIALAIFKAVI